MKPKIRYNPTFREWFIIFNYQFVDDSIAGPYPTWQHAVVALWWELTIRRWKRERPVPATICRECVDIADEIRATFNIEALL